ncbi:inositol monophosphatase [Nocardia sp. SYP-A9097]|uniref:inositol monophosphatase family protein n=1 Tax=Nocardia sp. SYP-A9097 TaxID=2663237 RepID=UPI00129BE736|nr:inositol monophosphatase family protein [Nocardia sp. SYP-A9097]MRH91366.1 inositol monophosphatase [Nocardia sp. SYP-A9097]
MTDMVELLGVARSAVAQGCALLRTSEPGVVTAKSDRDFVTELDVSIQEIVQEFLADATPEIAFRGEENGQDAAIGERDRYSWVLDPIDGTSNFIHGLPLCAVSLALVSGDGAVLGVIGAPFLDLEYFASAGSGAFRNGRPIRASGAVSLSGAIVSIGDYAVGAGAEVKNRSRMALTSALAVEVERVRMFGSAAMDLAWVAEGRTDACVLLSNKPWDMAAGVLIAKESGALVTDSNGDPHSLAAAHTVAAAPGIGAELLHLIKDSVGG